MKMVKTVVFVAKVEPEAQRGVRCVCDTEQSVRNGMEIRCVLQAATFEDAKLEQFEQLVDEHNDEKELEPELHWDAARVALFSVVFAN